MTLCYMERTMHLRTSHTDADEIVAFAVLTIGATLMVVLNDESVVWLALLSLSLAAAFVSLRPLATRSGREWGEASLDLSPWGVRRHDGGGLHEALAWPDLTEVSIVTAPLDPDGEDVYVVLRGRNNTGVIVPHTLAVESGILSELQLRLSEFDSEAFIDALASTTEKTFVLWRTPTPVSPLSTGGHSATPLRLRSAS